jgi:hypothetical protein
MTWGVSNSYIPSWYIGKALPNQQSQITASLELVSNGKPVNLGNQIIYWYQNDNLIGGGVGAQSIVFRPYGQAPNTVTLKVELPGYLGNLLIHEIDVPLVQPVVVIKTPYPQNIFSSIPLNLSALAYFFNASSVDPLSFSWNVDGQPITSAENPQSLQISLPQSTPYGYSFSTSLNVKNTNDGSTANNITNLTYQPQP